MYLTLSLIFYEKEIYDVIFVDQLSACVPLLKLTGAKVVFYCHFPDKLLTKRESILKMMYRWPIDKLEEITTGISDRILVNSQFTAGIFRESFPSIKQTPEVLYPSIHLESYDKEVNLNDPSIQLLHTQKKLILSINRFERKKNLALAIHAFSHLRDSA
ncbi:5663_t:CDS:2, partial [Paraglomus occultum]